jgi:hypothetical protein
VYIYVNQKIIIMNQQINGGEDLGLTGEDFTEGLVRHMQKYLPEGRWTIKYEDHEIVVQNDFNEVARYRLHDYGKSYNS